MRTYQTVVIIKADLDDSEVEAASEKVKQSIAKFSGEIIKLQNWGKKRLAYRLRKNRFGVYLNFYHTLKPSDMASFENSLRLDETILKYLVVRLESSEVKRIHADESSSLNEDQPAGEGEPTKVSNKESI